MLDRFYLLTEETEFLRDMEPHVRGLANWLVKSIQENNGFLQINYRQTWAWTLKRQGVVTGSQ
ncbi:MAG: hypothetical protein ACFCU1_02625 [Sumerlaeia bacterium]